MKGLGLKADLNGVEGVFDYLADYSCGLRQERGLEGCLFCEKAG